VIRPPQPAIRSPGICKRKQNSGAGQGHKARHAFSAKRTQAWCNSAKSAAAAAPGSALVLLRTIRRLQILAEKSALPILLSAAAQARIVAMRLAPERQRRGSSSARRTSAPAPAQAPVRRGAPALAAVSEKSALPSPAFSAAPAPGAGRERRQPPRA